VPEAWNIDSGFQDNNSLCCCTEKLTVSKPNEDAPYPGPGWQILPRFEICQMIPPMGIFLLLSLEAQKACILQATMKN
jgi:hypothetical protein